jgi:hypothetical protein
MDSPYPLCLSSCYLLEASNHRILGPSHPDLPLAPHIDISSLAARNRHRHSYFFFSFRPYLRILRLRFRFFLSLLSSHRHSCYKRTGYEGTQRIDTQDGHYSSAARSYLSSSRFLISLIAFFECVFIPFLFLSRLARRLDHGLTPFPLFFLAFSFSLILYYYLASFCLCPAPCLSGLLLSLSPLFFASTLGPISFLFLYISCYLVHPLELVVTANYLDDHSFLSFSFSSASSPCFVPRCFSSFVHIGYTRLFYRSHLLLLFSSSPLIFASFPSVFPVPWITLIHFLLA